MKTTTSASTRRNRRNNVLSNRSRTLSWAKILVTTSTDNTTTMKDWSVNVLCHRTTTKMRNGNVNDLLHRNLLERRERHNGGHFHQLFCHLRHTEHRATAAGRQRDLRHSDDLLDGCLRINEPEDAEDVHQLFPQLRHRSIQNLHERCKLGHMLREVPPHTPLRLHLDEKCWPHPWGKSRLSP